MKNSKTSTSNSCLWANDVSLDFSLIEAQGSDEYQTQIENESKALNYSHFENQTWRDIQL